MSAKVTATSVRMASQSVRPTRGAKMAAALQLSCQPPKRGLELGDKNQIQNKNSLLSCTLAPNGVIQTQGQPQISKE